MKYIIIKIKKEIIKLSKSEGNIIKINKKMKINQRIF